VLWKVDFESMDEIQEYLAKEMPVWMNDFLHLQHQHFNVSSFTGALSNINTTGILSTDIHENTLVDYITLGPMFPLMFGFHSLLVAVGLKQQLKKEHWLFSLLVTLISAVAGGTLGSLLLCQIPGWMNSNTMIPLAALSWYLVHYSPFDLVYKLATKTPLQYFILIMGTATRARSMINGVESAIAVLPQSAFAAILVGTVSGMGGTLVGNLLQKSLSEDKHLSEFSRPTWSSQSALFCATVYYILLGLTAMFSSEPHLSIKMARFLVFGYLVLHALTTQIAGPFTPFPLNIFQRLFYLFTRIPNKGSVAMPAYKVVSRDELHEIARRDQEQRVPTKKTKKN